MAFTHSEGQDVRITLGAGETGYKIGDLYLSGDKLYYIANIMRGGIDGRPVRINEPSAAGDVIIAYRRGEYKDCPKASGEVWAVGDNLYWDNTNKRLTKTASTNKLVAEASAPAISSATVGFAILK